MAEKILKKGNRNKSASPKKSPSTLTNKQTSKTLKSETYKSGLLRADNEENKYNRLFEQKLATQYREFRNLKDNHIQMTKFMKILAVLFTVMLLALFMITLSR